jgi:3-hydroxyacyl-[acyl-carrier-protein] dehydratase
MLGIDEIMKFVPHRYPFLLIDRVLEFQENVSATTLKNISINEAQFQGHFPQKPIFPGVYCIENMAQSACFLLAKSAGRLEMNALYVLGKVQKVSFHQPVYPGDQLITVVTLDKKFGDAALVSSCSRVDGKTVAKGEMMFSMIREQPEDSQGQ